MLGGKNFGDKLLHDWSSCSNQSNCYSEHLNLFFGSNWAVFRVDEQFSIYVTGPERSRIKGLLGLKGGGWTKRLLTRPGHCPGTPHARLNTSARFSAQWMDF
jgi:hypothetical protein